MKNPFKRLWLARNDPARKAKRCGGCGSPCTFACGDSAAPLETFRPEAADRRADGGTGDVPASWCKCCFECVLMQSMELQVRQEEAEMATEAEGGKGMRGSAEI